MNAVHELPPITISDYDFDRLLIYGIDAYLRGDYEVGFLLSELKRAELCHALDLPKGVVSLNCRAVYRRDHEQSLRSHFLVHPCDLMNPDEISVASPLGTALLGLRVGDQMPFRDAQWNTRHVVAVEGIGYRFIEDVPRKAVAVEH
ncbi:GreA/GreB family elongation factor [Methylobacterium oxalidis]|uniref:Transcription elongation factor GreA/GreB C-terminal domain-containing protein n=1 Tax=Methylobacterium oxalidis TaxID=944322 RepID=A0A512JBM2_9HYPH|nr:GreA/GreB family elongation factor [Methylobacterium oxalidis]GEP07336.1 hypothetical protein MOX02_53740 [Methylobacterium oxalidis]GJE35562.1 Regulator of nucleoside diphosphate kinase [Methylobacterium oxalidis]GLS64476.1 hypothetical protein GCM10007888_28570 [Methylobacterium oxalidis]